MDLPPEAKALIPPALGVLAGHLMRWSRAAKERRNWRRMVLFDLPSMIGLTLITAAVSRYVGADPIVASGIGTAVGYIGCEIVNILIETKFGHRNTDSGGPG